MAKFRALMLWTDAWIADTKHLTRCERGTYHDLLVLMWRTAGCSVPNDNDWLSKHLGMTIIEVEYELRPLISEFCQTDGNRIWQKRLKKEFGHSMSQSARAKSRWRKEKDECPENSAAIASVTVSVPVTEQERAKALSPSRRRARTQLPSDWTPPDFGPDEHVEFAKFTDHARANGRLCVDWTAAWRNWKRRAPDFVRATNGSWKDERQKENYDVSRTLREYVRTHPDEPRESGRSDEPPPWLLPIPKPA